MTTADQIQRIEGGLQDVGRATQQLTSTCNILADAIHELARVFAERKDEVPFYRRRY